MEANKKAKWTDRIMTWIFVAVAGFFLLLLAGFALLVIGRGLAGFEPYMLSFSREGIGNQLFNTLYLVVLSLLVSVPFGIATGVYLAEYAKPGRMTNFLGICI